MWEVYLIVSLFVLITGACIGSFLNVVALRALSGESIVFPSSKCPKCEEPIKWYDNIPVFSYLFTVKGKCRNCGEKISIQYPVVEAVTALMFLIVYLALGINVNSVLILILLCISEVIIITDIKEGSVFDAHGYTLIILSLIYGIFSKGLQNFYIPIIGMIVAVVIMELTAKLSYYLIRNKSEKVENKEQTSETEESVSQTEFETQTDSDENLSIDEYVEKNKRAFGEGDTYLAAASGAVLGWKYFIIALFCSILIQTVCIFPEFIKNLCDKKEYRLLTSLFVFFTVAVLYFTVSNFFKLNIFAVLVVIAVLMYFAFDSLKRLKNIKKTESYKAVPFGPALLVSTFILFFAGKPVVHFILKHVFLIGG